MISLTKRNFKVALQISAVLCGMIALRPQSAIAEESAPPATASTAKPTTDERTAQLKEAVRAGLKTDSAQQRARSQATVKPSAKAHAKAAVKKDRVTAVDAGPDIYAPVPTSEIDFSRYQIQTAPKAPLHVEVSASNWVPNHYSGDSLIGAGDYSSDTAKISLNFWTGAWQFSGLDLSPRMGLSYNQLIRSGQLPLYGQTINSTEVMNLFSLRAGLELTPQQAFFGQLQPFAAVSVLPTLASSPQSGVNEGSTQGFASMEETLGLNWNIPRFGPLLGVQKIGLEVGFEATQGIFGSPLTGVGFLAGTRVEL